MRYQLVLSEQMATALRAAYEDVQPYLEALCRVPVDVVDVDGRVLWKVH